MSAPDHAENEVVSIRKLAESLASGRRESLTTAHLLAAMASREDSVARLLRDRHLDSDVLARVARASSDEHRDPIGQAMRGAAELARKSGAREPAPVHLLLALLADRTCAAFRALAQCGTDVNRLRAAAIAVAGGLIAPRRASLRRATPPASGEIQPSAAASPASARARPFGTAVPVPLFPPSSRAPAPQPPAPSATPAPRPQPPRDGEAGERKPSPPAPRARAPARKRATAPTPRPAPPLAQPARFELSPKALPTVAALGVNLTLAAARGELEPVVARDVEIEQTLDVLAKRSGNCPCLVGSPGVGKTSVAHGLALRVASERPRSKLDDRVLVELPAAKLLSGTAARGSLAERMGALCREVREAEGRVVLFVDDLHQLLASDGAGEVGAELKSAVSRGDVPLVAATTPEEYRRLVESDPALCRCFTPIEIEEPDRERAVLMLLCARGSLARHHGVSIGDDAVEACVAWSVRYLPGRALPDKALAVLDFACARARRRQSSALHLDTIADVVAEMADVPAERLLETDRDRMLALESLLADRVVGHRQALERIAVILRRNAAGIRGRRPIGSFLLLGPTGVGKTETAKAIAEALFHSSDAMTRLDLSEFAEPHSLARLVGSPPGYVGHEAGGQLTEAVRRRPYQVLLLDEVEKAHRDVLQAFLQVLDEGRMTDGRGRTVDFTSTVVVMTSNLGSAEAAQAERAQGIGFARRADRGGADGSEAFVRAARQALAPELYNRIDEVLPYAPLGRAEVREIARRLLAALGRQLEQTRGASLAFDDDVVELLLERGGFDPALGARPMRRTIARLVEAPIADIVLRRQLGEGSALRLKRCRDGTVEVRVAASDC